MDRPLSLSEVIMRARVETHPDAGPRWGSRMKVSMVVPR
jgi:hypothetical protein